FFQAEDGIRDFHVTGVQTCALPIYAQESPWVNDVYIIYPPERGAQGRNEAMPAPTRDRGAVSDGRRRGRSARPPSRTRWPRIRRSEERRVGKEWRSRSSPEDHNRDR